jgi:DNA-binding GntR family transcriptional regulator
MRAEPLDTDAPAGRHPISAVRSQISHVIPPNLAVPPGWLRPGRSQTAGGIICDMSARSSATPGYARLERSSLRDQARQAIRTSIITGELEAGRLYTIGAFATELGVSATPVREALGDLATAGLVEIIRNRGFMIPVLSEDDLDQIFELRLMLEVPAVGSLTGRAEATELTECRRSVEDGKAAAKSGDLVGFLEADRGFHQRLLAPLDNPRLVDIVDRLRDEARLYGLPNLAADGRLVASALEHEALLDAVEAGDPRRAQEEMLRHLRHTRGLWAGRTEPST